MSFFKNILLLSLTIISCLSVHTMKAQSISIGGGLEYNLSIEEVGYHLRAYYNIGGHICFGPEFTAFGNKTFIEGEEEITESSVEYNFNGHYLFELSHKIATYPVIGLNHTRIEEKYTNQITNETGTENINTWAANVGWGAHYNVGSTSIFFEYHTNISEPGDHILSVGAFYTFGRQSVEEETHHE